MAEILIKVTDAVHSDPVKDERGCYKKGYPVVVMPDGHEWGNEEGLPKFVIIKCPEATVEQVKNYIESWNQRIEYSVVSHNNNLDRYRISVSSDINSFNISGKGKITRDQVEGFITEWNGSVVNVADNTVTFDIRIFDAACSMGFWNRFTDLIGFTENYDNGTGIHNIVADYHLLSNSPSVIESVVRRRASLVSHDVDSRIIVFDIDRNTIMQQFKDEVKEKVDRMICRRRFYFSSVDIDTVVSLGGVIMLTKTQLLSKIKDKLTEV